MARGRENESEGRSELHDVAYQELRGFSRSIAELEWLILVLVLLYTQVPGTRVDNSSALVAAMVVFAAFVIFFHYLNFYERESRWKLALESWVMLAFVSVVLWFTGMVESPLLNCYLLVIIASALTLGKVMTLLEVALICCLYLYMGYAVYAEGVFSFATVSLLMAKFAPFLLVAYLTTMLSADIQYAKGLLQRQSEVDELTGVMNMRGFKAMLEREVRQNKRYGRAFSLLMIDADGLKQVNDQLGHEAGNHMIQMVAQTIQSCLRGSDIVARFGGDEFVVMLPETDGVAAMTAAERIRMAVANTSVDLNGERIVATVSIGVACFPDDGGTIDDLLDKADRALYRSKNDGRNRATRFSV